jgi:YHS domain-containing protein
MRNILKNTLITTALAFGAVSTLTVTPAFAIDEVSISADAQAANLAVQGYDVVSYQTGTPSKGSRAFTAEFDGATYRFASQTSLDTFQADPARYVPAYGGFCAYGVSKGKKFEADPLAYTVVDGQLYLNLNQKILKKWRKKQAKYIDQAENNWPEIRSTAIGDL